MVYHYWYVLYKLCIEYSPLKINTNLEQVRRLKPKQEAIAVTLIRAPFYPQSRFILHNIFYDHLTSH